MSAFPIIRIITKLLIPYILLFAFYVQFHGDYGPGGGFQAGVIFASALILYGLVFGLDAIKKVAPPIVIEKCMALGVLVYAGTGGLTMALGGKFLDYDVLEHHVLPQWHVPSGQHLGIFLVELGVGITVTAVMTMIFYAFAGRKQVQ
ncbi:Na(+)/H(+) antiporter subunit B [Rhodopirellula sp. SWK7]|uniref:Na(+)/H(+) antiporter subunit B n=1 Tax=Rhodopirellula sp. SWK7 TaxID=595460 RepID=UPI0002BD37BC|nr:Na(+)/H(+) antiporter subunit B [Rhodopirellula sp. SWK7]EMI42835.1 monovalent cation/H+ antiporter subunit B [Rhodopirellula sp. SWK7]